MWRLQQIHGMTAMALTTNNSDRQMLNTMMEEYQKHLRSGNARFLVSDEAAVAIDEAIDASNTPVPPILPLKPYEKLGAIAEIGKLQARTTFGAPRDKTQPFIIKNDKYEVTVSTRDYQREYPRTKMHASKKTGETYTKVHTCRLEGTDTSFTFKDDNGEWWTFREHPETQRELNEKTLWEYFLEPEIPTIKELYPDQWEEQNEKLDILEALGDGWTYFEGQRKFLSSFAMLDRGLLAWEMGGGKTLAAFSLFYMKQAKRALFIVPKGTSASEDGRKVKFDDTPQWIAEAQKFAPDIPVFSLFTKDQYYDLLDEKGMLPHGIFLTYPHALFNNGNAFENVPKARAWRDMDGEEKFCRKFNIEPAFNAEGEFIKEYGVRYISGIGEERNGILCVANPSLATLCHQQFDMVLVDEAHLMCNPNSNTTKGLLRMQPKYRYAMTATPIPNYVYNIFSIMGWLAVDNWRLDRRRSPSWPYGLPELGRFKSAHVSKERDLTQEELAEKFDEPSPSPKDSATISQVPNLLYLIRKTCGYMSKKDINPNIVNCDIKTLRVPMGRKQHRLYAHYLQRKNMPQENALAKAMTQQTYLRCLCADPKGVDYNNVEGMIVTSNYNPKTVATLQMIADYVNNGEQVVYVAFNNGQINEIRKRLEMSGVSYSMIRGDVKDQPQQAAMFKRGETKVMLMNIFCAQAHSFENCKHLIIGSLEWSYGKFAQACGRVHRINSPEDVDVTVILHENTIEELLFEKVATKEDAATICMKAEHSNNEEKPVDPSELLAEHFESFTTGNHDIMDEEECERQWPELMAQLKEGCTIAL
jgi:SNF2 family DNA or RNA helicase